MDVVTPDVELIHRINAGDTYPLTDRERAVCIGSLVLCNTGVESLGPYLGIAHRTTKNHFASMYLKTGSITAGQLIYTLLESVTDDEYGPSDVNADLRAISGRPAPIHFGHRQIEAVDTTAREGSVKRTA